MAEQDPTAVEIWKAIPGYDGVYEASTLGRIRTIDRMVRGVYGSMQIKKGRIRKPSVAWTGYHNVTFWKDGKSIRAEMVHRVVLRTFVGPPAPGQDADHINFDRSDNRLENLRWLTRKENINHSDRAGRRKLGDRHPNSKLSCESVREIRIRRANGETQKEVGAAFGVHQWTISAIETGKSWKQDE